MELTIQVPMANEKKGTPAIIASCRDLGASWSAKRVVAVPDRLIARVLAVRAAGVTSTATIRRPHVPRLRTDSLPHRVPMGRVSEALRECGEDRNAS